MNYKVGDRIKIIETDDNLYEDDYGVELEIIEIDPSSEFPIRAEKLNGESKIYRLGATGDIIDKVLNIDPIKMLLNNL